MTTAAEARMEDIRFNHIRHVVASFLNDTKALHLERDLVDFLVKIDRQHQNEVHVLNLRLTEILAGGTR